MEEKLSEIEITGLRYTGKHGEEEETTKDGSDKGEK